MERQKKWMQPWVPLVDQVAKLREKQSNATNHREPASTLGEVNVGCIQSQEGVAAGLALK